MNRPLRFENIKKISYNDVKELTDEMDFFLSVDFSSSSKISSDYTGFSLVGVVNGDWYIFYLERERYELSESITKIVKLIQNFSNLSDNIMLVTEKGVIWNIAENMLLDEMEAQDVFFDISAVGRSNISKLDLILTLRPRIDNEAIFFVDTNMYQDGYEDICDEANGITSYDIVSTHDDLIDSLAQLHLVKDASIMYRKSNIENENEYEYDDEVSLNPYLMRRKT